MTNLRPSRPTAVIADDHEIVRSGLRRALETPGLIEPDGIEVVGEAVNGIETIERVKTMRPDLLLLDVSMPLASGAEVVLDIRRWSPDTRIAVVTAVDAPGVLAGLVDSGVHGLFSKAGDNDELFAKLPLILRGGRHVSEPLMARLRDAAPAPRLTPRERQTLTMIVSGKTNAEMAAQLGLSPKTVDKHRTSLMAKLEVHSAVELMSRALRDGLIEQNDQFN